MDLTSTVGQVLGPLVYLTLYCHISSSNIACWIVFYVLYCKPNDLVILVASIASALNSSWPAMVALLGSWMLGYVVYSLIHL